MGDLEDRIEYLRQRGADAVPHAEGRSLLDHLIGTAALLRSWGCDEDVCAAGLFHSVCGTEAFTVQICSPEEVRAAIGDRAASLVAAFGALDRSRFIDDVAAGRHRDDQGVALAHLMAANHLEQVPPGAVRRAFAAIELAPLAPLLRSPAVAGVVDRRGTD